MKEYNMTDLLAKEGIDKAIKRYGLEGTEEKIKSVYRNHPKIMDIMLNEYNKLLGRK